MRKQKTTYYCDMDGVLADFNAEPNAVKRFIGEPRFFYNLQPIIENVDAIKQLIKKGESVKILTTSPHFRADDDKIKWLSQHLPEVNRADILIARPHQPKITLIPTRKRKNAVLFDDYGKNIREWVENGGKYAIKILGERLQEENIEKVYQVKSLREWVS